MHPDEWEDVAVRTLQYLATSTPEHEAPNSVLVVVHGAETTITATLPSPDGVTGYEALWSSDDRGLPVGSAPGDDIVVSGPSVVVYRIV
jgi:glycogen operon protein